MIKKAGCILINVENKEIALVCRNEEYSFPKGHLERNETLIECAIRETKEETGHNCHLIQNSEIAVINYKNSKNEDVQNYFYLAIDDGITNDKIKEEDTEKTAWIKYSEVETMLSHQNLQEFWKTIKPKVEKIINNK